MGARDLGRENVRLGVTGGAAGNAAAADVADEEEAFGRTAVNWRKKEKQR